MFRVVIPFKTKEHDSYRAIVAVMTGLGLHFTVEDEDEAYVVRPGDRVYVTGKDDYDEPWFRGTVLTSKQGRKLGLYWTTEEMPVIRDSGEPCAARMASWTTDASTTIKKYEDAS